MSTDYRLGKKVLMRDLFDKRLEQHGIVEKLVPDRTSERSRVLVDKRGNYLWIYANDNGRACCLSRYGSQSPVRILEAISAEFSTEIYSEHEPQYYGFDTQEEWDAARRKLALEERDRFYEDIVSFVTGKEHGLTPGTIGMYQGEIAKALVLANADLLHFQNKDELLRAIDEKYQQSKDPFTIELEESDLALAKMIAADMDDLPRDPNLRQYDFLISKQGK
jgi:hypothetical protein